LRRVRPNQTKSIALIDEHLGESADEVRAWRRFVPKKMP